MGLIHSRCNVHVVSPVAQGRQGLRSALQSSLSVCLPFVWQSFAGYSGRGAINLLWLLPIALGVTQFGLNSSLGMILAYAPLVVLAIKFRAGELEKPSMKD